MSCLQRFMMVISRQSLKFVCHHQWWWVEKMRRLKWHLTSCFTIRKSSCDKTNVQTKPIYGMMSSGYFYFSYFWEIIFFSDLLYLFHNSFLISNTRYVIYIYISISKMNSSFQYSFLGFWFNFILSTFIRASKRVWFLPAT